jgi:hypothetical protein
VRINHNIGGPLGNERPQETTRTSNVEDPPV